MKIISPSYPDPTQFIPGDPYFDPKATLEKPIWMLVDVAWKADFKTFVSLERLRSEPRLAEMIVLRRGNRLSITPVTEGEFKLVCKIGGLTI